MCTSSKSGPYISMIKITILFDAANRSTCSTVKDLVDVYALRSPCAWEWAEVHRLPQPPFQPKLPHYSNLLQRSSASLRVMHILLWRDDGDGLKGGDRHCCARCLIDCYSDDGHSSLRCGKVYRLWPELERLRGVENFVKTEMVQTVG